MTYDQWKTTDPRDYEPEEETEEEPSELEVVYQHLSEVQEYVKSAHQRNAELRDALKEALEYFKKNYDVRDGDNGEQLPNEEMRLGTMIDETLYGIRF